MELVVRKVGAFGVVRFFQVSCEEPVLVDGQPLEFIDGLPHRPRSISEMTAGIVQAMQDGAHLDDIAILNLHKKPKDPLSGHLVATAFTHARDFRVFMVPDNTVGRLEKERLLLETKFNELIEDGFIEKAVAKEFLRPFNRLKTGIRMRVAQSIKHEVGHILTHKRISRIGKDAFVEHMNRSGYLDNINRRCPEEQDVTEKVIFEFIADDYALSLPNCIFPYNLHTMGIDLINPALREEGKKLVRRLLEVPGAGKPVYEPDYIELLNRPLASPPSRSFLSRRKRELLRELRRGNSEPNRFE